MKECPKCKTIYTDVTLSYCLSDGTPLVAQLNEEKTKEFSNFEVDMSTAQKASNTTQVSSSPTKETVVRTKKDFEEKKGVSPIWIFATLGLLGIILIGGISALLYFGNLFEDEVATNKSNVNESSNNNQDNKPTLKPTKTATPKVKSYRVVGVKGNDVLNIRPQAGNLKSLVGKIPPNGTGIKIIGGRQRIGKNTWILISYKGKQGWVNSKYITRE